MKKSIISIALMILVLVLVLLSFLGPWYGFHIKYTDDQSMYGSGVNSSFYDSEDTDTTASYYLRKVSIKGEAFGNPMSLSYDYSYIKDVSEKTDSETAPQFEKMMNLFDVIFYIMLACIVMSIIALIFSLGVLVPGKNFLKFKRLGMIFGIIVFILALISSFYFMIEWTNIINESETTELGMTNSSLFPQDLKIDGFWFSYSEGNFEYSIGPGYAWYLIIITGVISLISSIMLYLTRDPVLSQFVQPRYPSAYPPVQ